MNTDLVTIGVPDTVLYPGQSANFTITIPTTGASDLSFSCKNTSCGIPPQSRGNARRRPHHP